MWCWMKRLSEDLIIIDLTEEQEGGQLQRVQKFEKKKKKLASLRVRAEYFFKNYFNLL